MEEIEIESGEPSKPTIKHLVLAGGGAFGFIAYGALRESHRQGIWNLDNIVSIYGTSSGAMWALMVSLKFSWEVLDDFLIKRPWHHVFKINFNSIMTAYADCGILSKPVIDDTFRPLFKAKDIAMDVTMKELFDITGVELHMFGTEIDTFRLVDFSYKTHPEWKVLDVVYISCCLPILFSPYKIENKTYCDGGFFSNYPLYYCYKNVENPDEILGIRGKFKETAEEHETTLFDYILSLMIKMKDTLSASEEKILIKHEVAIESGIVSIYDIYLATSNMEERLQLIQIGSDAVKRQFSKEIPDALLNIRESISSDVSLDAPKAT
jgi:predicted acylesterase/phospholipase RssA